MTRTHPHLNVRTKTPAPQNYGAGVLMRHTRTDITSSREKHTGTGTSARASGLALQDRNLGPGLLRLVLLAEDIIGARQTPPTLKIVRVGL
ncbi:hypothetical protein EDD55_103265 [Varunaivibrio sulfuroxidans]|uniref:Uncharacterized protein n=1 Tax=Varunaivibrio sulfuroxidans TaxID=1773489 RepID=A0A4R3JCY7_9PROT|nr:hypothetical protein EDD55_103265 [Varunaivibrio sulfuroxidans]